MKKNLPGTKIHTNILLTGITIYGIIILILLSGCLTYADTSTPGLILGKALFNFVIPWDDASKSVINYHRETPSPAGKDGFIFVNADGHLADKKGRIRF